MAISYAAIVAILDFGSPPAIFGNWGQILNEIAFRITRTAEKETVPANAFEQFALAATFRTFCRWECRLCRKAFRRRLYRVNDEFFPELFDRFAPRQLAFFDLVEFFFEPRGKP